MSMSFAERTRSVGHWLRDFGLGMTGFALVQTVAAAGWTVSFIGLQDFGVQSMELSEQAAWLVPLTFDGAALGLSLVVFRASIHGRAASVWRLLIVTFTLLSSWINWQHIDDPAGRAVAALMPPAAVILFEGLMSEARAAAARRDGRERPRLHPLRWVIDRKGTWEIYKAYVLGIELPEHLQQAAADPPSERPVDAPREEQRERHDDALKDAPKGAPKDESKAPRRRPVKRSQGATRAQAKAAIRALYDTHGRRPLEGEMTAELERIKSPHTSRQHANRLRAEIESEEPKLAELGSDNVRAMTGS